jgi:undecaprenyl-diphosphatase
LGYFEAIVLGAVQGLTEFLPVSSSAHLILARAFFGWDADQLGMAFDVACHVGTLLAVVAFFRSDLMAMAAAVPGLIGKPLWPADGPGRQMRLIAAGTVPVVMAGLLLAGPAVEALRTPLVAACSLLVVAVLFLVVERVGARTRGEQTVTLGEAMLIGTAQALALVPGVSRSGATIAAGMFMGLRRDAAARFSFLLGVPAILAAAVHEGLHLLEAGMTADQAGIFLVGMTVSAVVGYATVKYFLKYLASHTLSVFAWYRIALAAVTLVWLANGRG